MTSDGFRGTSVSKQLGRSLKIDPSAWVFWITFILSYLASRTLIVATYGKYRIGPVILVLGILLFLNRRSLVNWPLLISILLLVATALLSSIFNDSSLLQIVSFVRIPLTAYLVYYLVAAYLTNKERAVGVFRIIYLLALIQLPILVFQRLAYPYLPERLKFSVIQGQLNQVDFAMGTFDGDAPMSFLLVALLILLLFYKQSEEIVKYKWFVAIWLTLTVFVGNSQIQHILIAIVWLIYLLSHLRLKTVFVIVIGASMLAASIGYLDRSGVLTFSPIEHTQARATRVFTSSGRQERIDLFLSGFHARDGAIYYYLQEPINWIGDGPGRYYNTFTRERTLGSWGHLFTFYAEVGIIGLLFSMLVFFIMAFPVSIKQSKITIQFSWVQAMMFMSILVVSSARYPMNTIAIIFTYCVFLIGYRIIAQPKYLRIL